MKNNFNLDVSFKNVPVMPYEWENTSHISHVKLLRISTNTIKDILLYDGYIKEYRGLLILSDTKEAIVLKLDREGQIKARSFLDFEDSLNVCEYATNMKETSIEFLKEGKKLKYPKSLSIDTEIKDYIVSQIKKCDDESFTKYLYYLYFNEINDYSKEKLIKTVNESDIDKNIKLYKFLIES